MHPIAHLHICSLTPLMCTYMSLQEAVHIVQKEFQKGADAEAACQVLIETAAERWAEEEGDYRDDVCIFLTL